MQKFITIIILGLFALTGLNACGVKPGNVDPPDGKGSSDFPRGYPDVKTDPTPYIVREQ